MGHLVGKDLYRKLGKKIDSQTMRAPWNDTFYEILARLYTPEEAELIVKMPYGLVGLSRIEEVTGIEESRLQKLLDGLGDKGLMLDFWTGEEYRYAVSPLVIGIFEFTMMRTRGELDMKEWARLFSEYLGDKTTFYGANFGRGEKISPLRILPYDDAIEDGDFVEILDYEKADAILDQVRRLAVGTCSCRHEKLHIGQKKCDIPLDTCTSFDTAADYMIRHGFAREVTKETIRVKLAQSKESRLVLCTDNTRKGVSFICHCCGCCCNILLGVSRFGYPNVVVTSNYIAQSNHEECGQCLSCSENCPVQAIAVDVKTSLPIVDESVCLGCGVCALDCPTEAMKLVKRKKRVLHPEDTFERVILQCLERGTLQNLIFSNPQSVSHAFMRGLVGGFLKLPPVKRSLMSDALRSRFLSAMRKGG